MGDRALIVLKEGKEYSPVVYLHWHAPQVQNYINRLKEVMETRGVDLSYAFARLVGIIHNDISGNLSLGSFNLPNDFAETDDYLKKMSHGDGGVYVVNLADYSIKTGGGYGLSKQNDKRDGGARDRELNSTEKKDTAA